MEMVDGQGVQVIHAPAALKMPVVDVDEQNLEALMKAEGAVPFDLAHEFPIRAKIFRLNPENHTLALTIHHSVFDGSSSNILTQEMSVLYAAFAAGQPSPLPEVDYQYADFAVWQQKWLESPDYEKQLAYWQARLSDHTIAEMPTDNPRPPVQTMNGAYYPVTLPQDVSDALIALSQREGTTLYMTMLAALQTLIFRYTGSEDIRVGTAIANRPRSEFEQMLGMFVNTLVLRTDLSGSPTFRDTLKRVREVALGAYAHQDLPFDRLVDALRPERDRSRSPLFQVLLVWEDYPIESLDFAGVKMHTHLIDNGTAKFDLSLYCYDHDGRIDGFFEYNTDLFHPETIERMSNHLQMLLRSAAEQPDQRLEELRLLTDEEEVQLLINWNQTQADYPAESGMHHVIEAQVERTPDKIAAIFDDQQISYRDLNRHANQLAHFLQKRGIGADMLVGLCVERSLDMLVGLLGILKTGAGYVPIDPTFPADRVAYMLEDAQANVLVTQSSLLDTLPQHQGEVVCLDTDWPTIQQEKDTNPNAEFAPENLAYTIYTSGSTGKPKGVQLQHQGVVNFLNSMR
ncbi:MAG: AMP-binding protein, partial [Anaerolineae bacterium]|nr:AMP-binding protein [Anaerolineae bacterium]